MKRRITELEKRCSNLEFNNKLLHLREEGNEILAHREMLDKDISYLREQASKILTQQPPPDNSLFRSFAREAYAFQIQSQRDYSEYKKKADETLSPAPQQQFDAELLNFLQIQYIEICVYQQQSNEEFCRLINQISELPAEQQQDANRISSKPNDNARSHQELPRKSKRSSIQQHSNCDPSNIPSTSDASIQPNEKRKRTSFDKSTEHLQENID